MAKTRSSSDSSNREKNREKLFSALVKLAQNLNEERQFLEDRIGYLNGVIYQIKMEQKVESAKTDLMLGLKEREAFIYKNRYEDTNDELANFREWFSYLPQKILEPKDPVDATDKAKGPRNKALQDEVKRLKSELAKIQVEKKSEVSALLDEKKFVWNQYSRMENDFSERLRKKSDEVELANEKILALINRADELQCSNERLKTDFAKMERDSSKKTQNIYRLSKEIEVLKSRLESETSVLLPCNAVQGPSHKEGNSCTINGRSKRVKNESDPSNTLEKMPLTRQSAHKSTGGKAPRKQLGSRMPLTRQSAHKSTGGKAPRKQLGSRENNSSKRKAVNVITIPDDTPKLFTSSFKVPKLKHAM